MSGRDPCRTPRRSPPRSATPAGRRRRLRHRQPALGAQGAGAARGRRPADGRRRADRRRRRRRAARRRGVRGLHGRPARRGASNGPVLDAVASGRPFLGICVGVQMLFDRSEETPGARGLGVLPGTVAWLPDGVKRPQMQWNRVDVVDADEPMFAGLGERPWFYFVHSLHGVPDDPSIVAATCDYGGPVNAAFRAGQRVRRPVPPREVGVRRARAARQLRDVALRPRLTAMTLLYPSIDLRGGRVVRLAQGDYAVETVYGDDPVGRGDRLLRPGRGVDPRRRPRRRPHRRAASTGRPWPPSSPPSPGGPTCRPAAACARSTTPGRSPTPASPAS